MSEKTYVGYVKIKSWPDGGQTVRVRFNADDMANWPRTKTADGYVTIAIQKARNPKGDRTHCAVIDTYKPNARADSADEGDTPF